MIALVVLSFGFLMGLVGFLKAHFEFFDYRFDRYCKVSWFNFLVGINLFSAFLSTKQRLVLSAISALPLRRFNCFNKSDSFLIPFRRVFKAAFYRWADSNS